MDKMKEHVITTDASEKSPVNNLAKINFVLLVIVLISSTIAIILAATSLSTGGTVINVGDSTRGSLPSISGDSSKYDDEVWLIAVGHSGVDLNVAYYDDTKGTLEGFYIDVINAVCAQAKMNCQLVLDIDTHCWERDTGKMAAGGKGLMNRWYDACAGWFNTYERGHTFLFSNAFQKTYDAAFYVLPGNPRGFDPTSVAANQRIGFIDGWYTNEFCLARNSDEIEGLPLSTEQVVYYQTRDEMFAAANNNEIDAVFQYTLFNDSRGLVQVGGSFSNCYRDGAGMMTRKDSTFNSWWNPAFNTIRENGVYHEICTKLDEKHGHVRGYGADIMCLD